MYAKKMCLNSEILCYYWILSCFTNYKNAKRRIALHNDSRINYFNFISSLKYNECNRALKRITARIDMNKVNTIIDETPFISDLYKKFYKTMLAEGKEHILDHSLTLLHEQERQKDHKR